MKAGSQSTSTQRPSSIPSHNATASDPAKNPMQQDGEAVQGANTDAQAGRRAESHSTGSNEGSGSIKRNTDDEEESPTPGERLEGLKRLDDNEKGVLVSERRLLQILANNNIRSPTYPLSRQDTCPKNAGIANSMPVVYLGALAQGCYDLACYDNESILLPRERFTSLVGDILSYSAMLTQHVEKEAANADVAAALTPGMRCQQNDQIVSSLLSFLLAIIAHFTFVFFLLALHAEGATYFFYTSAATMVLAFAGRMICIFRLSSHLKSHRMGSFICRSTVYLIDPKSGKHLLQVVY
jgi:hypothetical protein